MEKWPSATQLWLRCVMLVYRGGTELHAYGWTIIIILHTGKRGSHIPEQTVRSSSISSEPSGVLAELEGKYRLLGNWCSCCANVRTIFIVHCLFKLEMHDLPSALIKPALFAVTKTIETNHIGATRAVMKLKVAISIQGRRLLHQGRGLCKCISCMERRTDCHSSLNSLSRA